MKKILFIMFLTLASCATPKVTKSDKPITVLYDYEIKDTITIVGRGLNNIQLSGYKKSLSSKFSKILYPYYSGVQYGRHIPLDGPGLLLGIIRPEVGIQNGDTFCSIWYYYKIFENRKEVNEYNKFIKHAVKGDKLDEGTLMALITLTHQKMIDENKNELLKHEADKMLKANAQL